MAIEYGKKAMELLPVSLDAWFGTNPELAMLDIYIFLGKYNLALEKIERLLSIPSDLGLGWLLVDPKYEGIRDHPRFKKLVEKYK